VNKVQLLALLRSSDMRWDERVHEGLEIGSPPLRQRITDLPLFIDTLTTELRTNWSQALIQSNLEAFNLVILGVQVVSRQLEEGVGDLQHQDVGMVMFVADKNAFASPSHSMSDIVLFKALEACEDGGVFFRLGFLGTEGVVREGVEADCFGLVAVE
jgi:hypothetical protein